jgi:hypothetical protein
MTSNPTASFELVFSPSFELVNLVRRFVTDFYTQVVTDPDGASRVGLATHELLENAVKYSRDGKSQLRISLTRDAAAYRVKVSTTNAAAPEHIESLRRIFAAMAQTADPQRYYQDLLKQVLGREGSGLGIGRIAAESDMTMTLEVMGSEVVICGVTTLGGAR